MAGNRTLKLSILADVDNLKKNLDSGSREVSGFGDKLSGFGKKAGAAFAVAGVAAAAYAGKLLVDGVKAAIEDEAAQLRLATSLKNVTGATDAQIKATEDYILKTSLATGVTDDQLRPSLDRLVRSTGSVQKAQELQTLALNIAAGTGKNLSQVSEALAKAHDGNFAALKKLGGGIDESIIKSKDFDAATQALAATFKDQASIQADTFEGKMGRLQVAFSEAKETVGSYVLNAINPLVSTLVDKGIPAITNLATNLGETLGPAFTKIFSFIKDELLPILVEWWKFLLNEVVPMIASILVPILDGLKNAFYIIKGAIEDNSEELKPFYEFLQNIWKFISKYLAPVLGTVLKGTLEALAKTIAAIIKVFTIWFNIIKDIFDKIMDIVDLIKNNPLLKGIGNVISNISNSSVPTPSSAPSKSSSATINNITVNGAIDSEGTARAIINALNQSMYRGTGGAGALA